ncbi:ABC transporter permease [Salegentibacter salegens]|uniref:ABC-2 type transport system permease protein n=1 Tax=Salegentibacter salegens TaxID=143223 RepID=A0A1M7NRJ7_9FLAO|nr:ABC transporter permease [Salegentibacter salegens]PRX42460.1 ABC-2 type transport system permease protein [Salegentibacter salegens]SHN06589.1 ABC-2 type transport system permease protein [Salegentibacter salegens]
MRNLKLIIQREYLARVRNKTFIIMTFLSPLILIGMFALIAYLSMLNSSEQRIIGLYDETEMFASEFKDQEQVQYLDLSGKSLDEAKQLVNEQDYYGLIYIPENLDRNFEGVQFFGKESPGLGTIQAIEKTIADRLTREELIKRGIDVNQLNEAKTEVRIEIQNFSGERTSKMSNYIKMFFGGAAGYLLMMFIIIYGNMVMRSVIEEKTNRIIEIIVSSVKPIQLMMGKVLGTSLAGITQFTIWVLLASVLAITSFYVLGIDIFTVQKSQLETVEQIAQPEITQLVMDVLNLPILSLVIFFLIYFIGGYFLYSAIYAAIGAAVDSETDTQQFMFPVILPLMLGIYVGFFSVIENPHGSVSTIFSMIPLTSPIVMLMRIPFGVPWWELAISIAILIITNFGVIWLAAKIYRVGILMYGKKASYKELFKWLKY